MIFLIYGKDTFRSRRVLEEFTSALIKKNSNSVVHNLDGENCSKDLINQLLADSNLFGQKFIVVLRDLLTSDLGDFVLENLKKMSASANAYIIFEKEAESAKVKKIEKLAHKTQKLEPLNKETDLRRWVATEAKKIGAPILDGEADILIQNNGNNLWAMDRALELRLLGGKGAVHNFTYEPFELADMFSRKNFRGAYLSFEKGLAGGISSEEMFWKLWWQTKNLLLVQKYKNLGLNESQIKQKTGLHPFVVKKSLSALSKFNQKELEKIFDELFLMWYESRLGLSELPHRIEQLLLAV